jgi:2-oxoglutarate ferredoxin oxidoreductase subunit beta
VGGATGRGGGLGALDLVPRAKAPQSAKDFKTDQEVRWCPGCGDYAILAAVQSFMPELGLARENVVFVSGIGCSSRFPYYMDTFGMHSIHGRAPAIATGLATSRPDLSVWVVTGDGDALSIGGNHLIHALRRNVNLKILLFNNRIYGLTKGQYSPTSELGKITKSTPFGSLDAPFNPVSLALGAEATFVARSIDTDRKHLTAVLRAAAEHRGTALVEIYQNCNIFNDNAFEPLKDPDTMDDFTIRLEHGQPIRWGADGEHAVVRAIDSSLKVVEAAEVDESQIVVHDAYADDPSHAFDLSRLADLSLARTPIGVFRSVRRPVYDDLMREQLEKAAATQGAGNGTDQLTSLLAGADTWTVG